ncbi:MAG: hypothetical protein Q9227_000579 [Pyrenula ochraceoflavens]
MRYQLGDGHAYEFVEGFLPEQAAPGLEALSSSKDQHFAYFYENSPSSCLKALNDLDHYVKVYGPFDGVIAFSNGASLASTLLVRYARHPQLTAPFRMAIFFSGGLGTDPEVLLQDKIQLMEYPEAEQVITIPTVHVWGDVKQGETQWPPKLEKLCAKDTREDFQHAGGHEIPGSKDQAAVRSVVHLIRRAIWRANKAG